MYDLIQSALTASIEFIAIAGFGGIAVHALYSQHKNFMTEFCPAFAPYTRDTQAEESPAVVEVEQPTVADPWIESEVETVTNVISFQPVSRHFSPQLALPAAKEVKQALKATTRKPRTKKAQPLAEELGLTPPSDWGKVQKAPAKARTPRKRKTA